MFVLVPRFVHDELTAAAGPFSPKITFVPYDEDEEIPVADADRAEVVFRWVAGKRYAHLVAYGPQVRWLHTASAGVDHVLTPPVRAKANLLVTDSGPAFEIAISEFVIGWMLATAHKFYEIHEQQRDRIWKWVTQEELSGQTLGIVGLGPIGTGIARRARALGMRTLGLRRAEIPHPDVDETLNGTVGLARLITESDWVVLAAALTGETRTLIGANELAAMKPSARLINIARGPLVDEAALIAALERGTIAGACLDVFATEPLPPDNPLWSMPNVHISPHTSPGWSASLRRRQIALFLSNLDRFRDGRPLENVVDLDRGY